MNREYLGTEYRTTHLNNASGTECYNDGYNLLNYEQYGRVVWQTLLLKKKLKTVTFFFKYSAIKKGNDP